MLAGESTDSPQQIDHPIFCEMLNSPYEWKMALEDGEKIRIQKEV